MLKVTTTKTFTAQEFMELSVKEAGVVWLNMSRNDQKACTKELTSTIQKKLNELQQEMDTIAARQKRIGQEVYQEVNSPDYKVLKIYELDKEFFKTLGQTPETYSKWMYEESNIMTFNCKEFAEDMQNLTQELLELSKVNDCPELNGFSADELSFRIEREVYDGGELKISLVRSKWRPLESEEEREAEYERQLRICNTEYSRNQNLIYQAKKDWTRLTSILDFMTNFSSK